MTASSQYSAPALTLNPGLRFEPHHRGIRVWNPQQRKHLLLPVDDVGFLLGYNGGAQPERSDQAATDYLRRQKYAGAGLLRMQEQVSSADFGEFIFGEHPLETVRYFEKRCGFALAQTKLSDLPHLTYLQQGAPAQVGAGEFTDFLHALVAKPGLSYSAEAVRQQVQQAADSFREMYARFNAEDGAAAMLAEPFQAALREDGKWVLLEHTGRACIALALGYDVSVIRLDPADWLGRVAENPNEFFGSSRGNIPYHSIYNRRTMLVEGVRTDLYERQELMADEDLRGKRVLDFGSNIGMNCIIACERGATHAQGLEYSEYLVRSATRLTSWLNHPCAFRAVNLNHTVSDLGTFDTAFFFALLGHLEHGEGVLQTIKNCGVKVVYFESHCDVQPQGDMEGFLGNELFSEVKLIGHTSDNTDTGMATRKFYRLQVRA